MPRLQTTRLRDRSVAATGHRRFAATNTKPAALLSAGRRCRADRRPGIVAALRALVLSAMLPAGTPEPLVVNGPGTALFNRADALFSLDERAAQWFTELTVRSGP